MISTNCFVVVFYSVTFTTRNLGDIVHRSDSSNSNNERHGSLQSAHSFLSWLGYHGSSDNGNSMPRRVSSGALDSHTIGSADRQNSITASERETEEHHYQVNLDCFEIFICNSRW